jgi:hypothetical protein
MTPALPNRMTILLADDDFHDCLLVRDAAPRPGLILLDLSMPKKDGW